MKMHALAGIHSTMNLEAIGFAHRPIDCVTLQLVSSNSPCLLSEA